MAIPKALPKQGRSLVLDTFGGLTDGSNYVRGDQGKQGLHFRVQESARKCRPHWLEYCSALSMYVYSTMYIQRFRTPWRCLTQSPANR
jgi:hypothetical protein